MSFVYIWEYKVHESQIQAFEVAYGRDGEWMRLFMRDPSHIQTELLADSSNPVRFLTIDHWSTRAAFAEFRERFSSEFDAIDNSYAQYTIEERHVADFDLAD
jgi:hypothetical protein